MAVNGEVAVAEMELDSPPSDRSPAEVMELDPRPSDLPTDNDQGLAVTGTVLFSQEQAALTGPLL